MTTNEFAKIWRLFQTLFPASPRVKSENDRIVWEVALGPFGLDDVTAATMEWARKSKFFPDIADITSGLTPQESHSKPHRNPEQPYGDVAWMAPYIRKLIADETDAKAEEINAAGLLTWREAEAAGVDFAEWNRAYEARFPVGSVAGNED